MGLHSSESSQVIVGHQHAGEVLLLGPKLVNDLLLSDRLQVKCSNLGIDNISGLLESTTNKFYSTFSLLGTTLRGNSVDVDLISKLKVEALSRVVLTIRRHLKSGNTFVLHLGRGANQMSRQRGFAIRSVVSSKRHALHSCLGDLHLSIGCELAGEVGILEESLRHVLVPEEVSLDYEWDLEVLGDTLPVELQIFWVIDVVDLKFIVSVRVAID